MSLERLIESEEVEENVCLFPKPSPLIFEGSEGREIPSGFNAVTIYLDGRIQADLNWKKEREQALCAVEKGLYLMWDMQLGLFGELRHPLTHQGQFLSLTLSLEHFRDSLWKEFQSHTLGVSLFRGSVDFSHHFPWDPHQEQNLKTWLKETCGFAHSSENQQLIRLFCRDVSIEYIALLANRLPDSLSPYLFLDATLFAHSPATSLQLLNPDRFDRLYLAIKGNDLPFRALGWQRPTSDGYSGHSSVQLPTLASSSVAVCIPSMDVYSSCHYQGLEEGIHKLRERSIPFKLIAESQLTSEWDGLDYLLYSPTGLSPQGKRKLQGFCAAGGTLISTGALLGFPYEISLSDWTLLS